jgi:hypothetical protein
MAIPQLSYQAKNTSARERGAFSIQSEVVLKGEPFTVHKDGGIIKSIDHEIDYTGRDLPTEKNVVAGYGVIQQVDGKRFYKIVTRNEINRARNTASTKRDSATPWNTDYEAMCRKTIEARMQEDYVGDFTQYGGGVAAAPAPVLEGEPQATPGGDLADALFARAEHYEPTVMERAQAMFEVCETAEQVSGLKATDAFKQLWLDASKDERDQIGSMGQQRHNELDAQARSENDDAEKQTGGGAPAGDGTVPAGGEGATPASPPVEHDGAEVQAGLDLGGEDEPTALGQPPAFPTLPESVLPFAEAKKGHPIKAVVKELRDAWSKLSEEPGSVEALLRRREAAWGGMVTTSNEVDALGSLIEVCQFVLDDVGYPSGM